MSKTFEYTGTIQKHIEYYYNNKNKKINKYIKTSSLHNININNNLNLISVYMLLKEY